LLGALIALAFFTFDLWAVQPAVSASGDALSHYYRTGICLLLVGGGWLIGEFNYRASVRESQTAAYGRLLKNMIDQSPIGLSILNARMEAEQFNQKAIELTGTAISEEVRPGTSVIELSKQWQAFDWEGNELLDDARPLARLIKGENLEDEKILLVNTSTAKKAWVSVSAGPVFDADHGLTGFVIALVDLNQSKQAQDALQAEKQRFQDLWDDLVDVAYELDENGRITKMSPAAHGTFGFRPEEVEGRSIVDFYRYPDQREGIARALERDGELRNAEAEIRRKDGSYAWVSTNAKVITDETGNFVRVMGITRDITALKASEHELKQLDEQLRHAQRLASLGTLAGGIAHDFNNLLGAILGNAELAKLALSKANVTVKEIERIILATHRASALVERILQFSRKGQHTAEPVDLSQIFEDAVSMLDQTITSSARLVTEVELSSAPLYGDAGGLEQVLVNIGINALQAANKAQGEVVMTLDKMVIERSSDQILMSLSPGIYARICVSDNGPGIDAQPISRIFEPYYTTKRADSGTGLGLSIAHSVVEGHGGSIEVESVRGKGTTFSILLPLAERQDTRPNSATPGQLPLGQKQRVLLVDDEPLFLEVLEHMVASLGYRTEITSDPFQALEWLKDPARQFDLLFTDQTMPGLTGTGLISEVRRAGIGLPAILCTGLLDAENIMENPRHNTVLQLQKPLERTTLAEALQVALTGKAK